MADMYVGTPNGVQTIGGGGNCIIPKGKVVLTEARTTSSASEVSTYQSDELIGKSVIDVNIMYNNDANCNDRTIRCFADCSEGLRFMVASTSSFIISVKFISSTGTVSIVAYYYQNSSSSVPYSGKITAFYYE